MAKMVRKFLIGDLWRIGEHENWFSHMASEGYHLKKVGKLLVHFKKGDTKDTRYRIEAAMHKNIPTEQKELYKDAGWAYVTKFGEFHVFSSPGELKAPELHTDPVEQSYTLKKLDDKIKMNTIFVAILSTMMVGIQIALWFLGDGPTLTLIEDGGITYITTSLVVIVVAYSMLRATISIRRLRKSLSEGIPIDHDAPWKKHRLVNVILSTTIIIIAACGAVPQFVQITMQKTEILPVLSTDLPIVRLADVEQNTGLVREEFYDENGIDRLNEYSSNWSPFTSLQYESNESGIVSDEIWKDGSGAYSPSIYTQVYKLVFPSMRESLVSDLIARNDIFPFEGDLVRRESKQFDTLFISEIDGIINIFAAKGRGVIYVRYFGYADLDVLLENVKEIIGMISK